MDDSHKPLSHWECFAFLMAMIGVQLSSELFAQWGTYFYSPSSDTGRMVYVSIGLVAFIFMAGRVFDFITDPFIGAWSDHASQRPGKWRIVPITGRRRPFIFWGSILMTVTGIVFWYPPVAAESTTNLIFGTVVMSIHWGVYTLAYIPLLALAPEMARTEKERMHLGTWIGVGMILGLVMAALLPGILIAELDPAREISETGESGFSPVGYQRVAIIFSFVSLFCFQWFVWVVKERPISRTEALKSQVYKQLGTALKVPTFRLYLVIFFLFYIGLLSNQRALPYWVELGIGGDEGTVSLLGIPFIVTCLAGALACPWLIKKIDLKWLVVVALASIALGMPFMYVIAGIQADDSAKFWLASIVYGLKGIGLGMMYVLVTPLIGEIIDRSAEDSGERQEAVFNAMHAMMVKFAQVIGIFIAVQTMSRFGNSSEQPLGVFLVAPVSSLFCIAAIVLAFRYPNTKKET
jgi:Na+/melibiose symporter-like transporter